METRKSVLLAYTVGSCFSRTSHSLSMWFLADSHTNLCWARQRNSEFGLQRILILEGSWMDPCKRKEGNNTRNTFRQEKLISSHAIPKIGIHDPCIQWSRRLKQHDPKIVPELSPSDPNLWDTKTSRSRDDPRRHRELYLSGQLSALVVASNWPHW